MSEATTEASQQMEIHHGITAKSRVQSEGSFGTTYSAMTSDYTKFNKQRHKTTVDSLQRMSFSSTVQNGLRTDAEYSMTRARNGGSDSGEVSWSTVEFQPNSTPMPTEDKPTELQLDLQQYTMMNKMELSTVESQLHSTSVKDTTKEESETGDFKETTVQDELLMTVSERAEVETETTMPYTDDEFIQITHKILVPRSITTPKDEKIGFPLGSTVSNDFETESQHHIVTKIDDDSASGTQRWSTREGNHQITRKFDTDVIPDGYSMASKGMQHTLTTGGTTDVGSGDLDVNSGEEFMTTRETAHPVTTNGNIDVNSRQNHMSTIDMQHPVTIKSNSDVNSGEEFTSTRENEHQGTTSSTIDTGFKDNSMSTRDLEDPMTTSSNMDNMDVSSGQNYMATRDMPHLMTTSFDIDVTSGEKPMSTTVIEHPIMTNSNVEVSSGQNHMSTIDMQHPITTNTNIHVNSGEEFMSTREIEHPVTTSSNADTSFNDNPVPTRDFEHPMTTNSDIGVSSGQNHMTTGDIQHIITTNSNIDAGFEDEFTSTRDMGHPKTTSSNTGVSAEENLMSTRDIDHSMTTNNNMDVASGSEPLSTRGMVQQTTISSNFDVSSGDELLSTGDMGHSVTTDSNFNFGSGQEPLSKSTRDTETHVTTVNMPDIASRERPWSSSDLQPPMTTEGNKRVTYGKKSTSIGGMQYKTSSDIDVGSFGESTRYIQDDRTTEISVITGKVSSSTTSVLHPMTTDSDINVGSGEESMSTSKIQATSKPRTTAVRSSSEKLTSVDKVEKTTVPPSLEFTTQEGLHDDLTTLTLEKTNKGNAFQSTNAPEIVSTQIVGMFNFLMKLYFICSCFVKKSNFLLIISGQLCVNRICLREIFRRGSGPNNFFVHVNDCSNCWRIATSSYNGASFIILILTGRLLHWK